MVAIAELSALFKASLDPQTRKQAETILEQSSLQPGFAVDLLALTLDNAQDRAIRLSSGVYLKNIARKRWTLDPEDDVQPIPEDDKIRLRQNLILAMIQLSGPSDKALRAQIAESVSLVAAADFPSQWPTLFDELVNSLSPTQLHQTLAILETAHSICGPWRSAIRSDNLYTMINLVLDRFANPFLQVFRVFAGALFEKQIPNDLDVQAQISLRMLQLYYDLTAQDLPPIFEDSLNEFFAPTTGWFPRYLQWESKELAGEPDDTTPSLLSSIKTTVLEIAELFTSRYSELFGDSTTISSFIQTVWIIVSGGAYTAVGDDPLIAQCMRLLSTTIRSGQYKDIYNERNALEELVRGIVVPNVQLRDHEVEQFEDDPLEFIRLDLSLPSSSAGTASFSSSGGGDGTTRRQAAADVVRSLVNNGYEQQATEIVSSWVNLGLQQYTKDPGENWKSKDSAIFLISAVAARGVTTQQGITSVNPLVDVVDFFSKFIAQDLQSATAAHPVLQVDAIRFLYTFRSRLSKEQLLSVLPLLVQHLYSPNYVVYTYSAIAIERILFMKQPQSTKLLFEAGDVSSFAQTAIEALLAKMEAGKSPEKIAENEYLMKCVMRIVIAARGSLAGTHDRLLNRIIAILGAVSRNPSNPNFNQYTFETVSALIRFIVPASPTSLPAFEQGLLGPLTYIIREDIDRKMLASVLSLPHGQSIEFVPYAFQIVAQLLELNQGVIPDFYNTFLTGILQVAPWQQKGSIPGLVRLVRAFLDKDSTRLIQTGQITTVFGIIQQRLIPSKLHDGWAFELLEGIVSNIPAATMQQYLGDLVMTLLKRAQTSRTDKFVVGMVHWVCYTASLESGGYTPDTIPTVINQIQANLWVSVLKGLMLPVIPKIPPQDKRLVSIGLVRLLFAGQVTASAADSDVWPLTFGALLDLFSTQVPKSEKDDDPDAGITAIDYEEQTTGYQVAYSKLAASEIARPDPVAYAGEPMQYLMGQLSQAVQRTGPATWQALIQRCQNPAAAQFVQAYMAAGNRF
ncbi:Importin alpha re-exporter AltName: Full=Chromosome segregation protein CSE1 [Serendipita indica DSM 11827]|uniref:Probable importin-alpha export receptor n=1 Tax=Serendipita indica (strain DSM 11827) TaxID=1109443 RepID=G4TBM7_SERID|nr:Importin alpha re-exporter AltName: Full=Chromosome segregation protein CSE1 [Serendipita indica DSM 11827]CCA68704.1 probable importin-alpha export receptor [Serendipita indica DSM 11827]